MPFRGLLTVYFISTTMLVFAQDKRPKKVAQEYFQLGETAFRNTNWLQAEAYYDSCLAINATHFNARYSRAISRENSGDPDGAISDYGILIHLEPEMTEILWSRAILYYQVGYYDLANEDLYKLLKLPEEETNAVYFRQKYPDTGVSQIATLKTMRSQIYNYLGMVAEKKQEYKLAILHYNRAISLDSSSADILVNRAQVYESMDDTHRAEADLRSALIIDPSNTIARYNLARLQEENASHNELINTYTEILANSPEFAEAYAKRGLAKMNTGDLQGALTDYDSAIFYNSEDPLLWMNRGIIKLRVNKLPGAYSDLSKALDIKYDLENAWLNRGNVLTKMKRYEDAIQDYNIALIYYPEFVHAYYNRGIARYNNNEKELACKDLKKAMDLGMRQAEGTFEKMCH